MSEAAALMDEPEAPNILLANIRAAKAGDSHAFENVATILGNSPATVRVQVSKAREKLRRILS